MKPNREQRYQLYKLALEIHLRDNTDRVYNNNTGLCCCIDMARLALNKKFTNPYRNMKAAYPEIFKHKPWRNLGGRYWFPVKDIDIRTKILRQAKRETR